MKKGKNLFFILGIFLVFNFVGVSAIDISDCGLLDQSDSTYVLQNDVTSNGNCFVVKGNNIVLDLNGYTVYQVSPDTNDWYYAVLVHPSWPGVPADWRGGGDYFRVTNGKIVQLSTECKDADGTIYGSTGTTTDTIYLRSCDDCEIDNLEITIQCHDSGGFYVRGGANVNIHDNIIYNNVQTLSDRHFPGESSISVQSLTGTPEISFNQIIGGPHIGINLRDSSPTLLRVFNNEISHSEKYVNGYAIMVKSNNVELFNNVIKPITGRGIHLTGNGIEVYNNTLDIKVRQVVDHYPPDPELIPCFLNAHAIKIEGGSNMEIYNNNVTSTQPTSEYGPASPLNINSQDSQNDINIHDNNFTSYTSIDPVTGEGSYCAWGSYAPGVQMLTCAGGYTVTNNHFKTNDRLIFSERPCGDLLFENNIFELYNPVSNSQTFVYTTGSSRNIVYKNNEFIGFDVDDYSITGDVQFEINYDATISVRNGIGDPISNPELLITDVNSNVIYDGLGDAEGNLEINLVDYIYDDLNSPKKEERNPYEVTFSKTGYSQKIVQFDLRNSASLVITSNLIGSCGGADTSGDGSVSSTELLTYISLWRQGSVSSTQLLAGINEWRNGC